MDAYTEGEMSRAWNEGWHAGFNDSRRPDGGELTPNPYAQSSSPEPAGGTP